MGAHEVQQHHGDPGSAEPSRFVEIEGGAATRFECDVEYTKFNGIVPKLMGLLFPGIFRKQAQTWFDQFKTYAEQGED